MRPRYTLIVLGIVLIVGVLAYRDLNRPREMKQGFAFADNPGFSLRDVTRIEIERGAERIVLARSAGGRWRMEEPVADDAEQARIGWISNQVSSAWASEKILDEDLAQYGLGEKATRVRLLPESAGVPPFALGDTAPGDTSMYLRVEGLPEVLVVDKSFGEPFALKAEAFRAEGALGAVPEDIERLETERKDGKWSFVRMAEGWAIEREGVRLLANSVRCDTYARALCSLRVAKFRAEAGRKVPDAPNRYVARMKDGTRREMGFWPDEMVAAVSVRPGELALRPAMMHVLVERLEEFFDPRVFVRSAWEASAVERRRDGKAVFRVERAAGGQWRLAAGGSFRVGREEMEVYLDKLTRLTVVSWPFVRKPGESPGQPDGDLTVEFASGSGGTAKERMEILSDPSGEHPGWLRRSGAPELMDAGERLREIREWTALDFHPRKAFEASSGAAIREIAVEWKAPDQVSWRVVRAGEEQWTAPGAPAGMEGDPEACERYADLLARLRAKRVVWVKDDPAGQTAEGKAVLEAVPDLTVKTKATEDAGGTAEELSLGRLPGGRHWGRREDRGFAFALDEKESAVLRTIPLKKK